MLQPYFDDFKDVAPDQFDIFLFDSKRPIASQFQGIDVVVEHGGAYSTPEMLDAGVKSGVKLWQVTATGLDHVNVESFLERGIAQHTAGFGYYILFMWYFVFAMFLPWWDYVHTEIF